jgi:hypothetical protein
MQPLTKQPAYRLTASAFNSIAGKHNRTRGSGSSRHIMFTPLSTPRRCGYLERISGRSKPFKIYPGLISESYYPIATLARQTAQVGLRAMV